MSAEFVVVVLAAPSATATSFFFSLNLHARSRSRSQALVPLSLSFSREHNRTIEIRLDEVEQDTQCAVCLGEFGFFSTSQLTSELGWSSSTVFSLSPLSPLSPLSLTSLCLSLSPHLRTKTLPKESSAPPGSSGLACIASVGPASSAG